MLVFSVRSTVSIAPQRCVFSRCTLFLRERRYHAAFYPARVRFSPQHSHLPRPGASPPLECAWSRCRLSTVASELGSASEVEELIAWRSSFTRDSIPYRSFAVQHARSSGPGGQNVNKVNTKVDVRFVLDDAQWLPGLIKKVLRRTVSPSDPSGPHPRTAASFPLTAADTLSDSAAAVYRRRGASTPRASSS